MNNLVKNNPTARKVIEMHNLKKKQKENIKCALCFWILFFSVVFISKFISEPKVSAKAISKVVLSDGRTLIDLTSDDITAADVTSGKKAHGADGKPIVGTNTKDIDSSGFTARASEILSGKTAGVGGQEITGEMPNRGAVTGVISRCWPA